VPLKRPLQREWGSTTLLGRGEYPGHKRGGDGGLTGNEFRGCLSSCALLTVGSIGCSEKERGINWDHWGMGGGNMEKGGFLLFLRFEIRIEERKCGRGNRTGRKLERGRGR